LITRRKRTIQLSDGTAGPRRSMDDERRRLTQGFFLRK
jgi:hypothetical protein